MSDLISNLENHQSLETRAYSSSDKILIGILHLCEKLLLFKKELRDVVGNKENNNLAL